MSEPDLLQENIDYELIPQEETDGWDVRILKEYPESIIRFGNIMLDGRGDDTELKYNFRVVSSPDPDLTESNEDLQYYVGDLLYAIIRDGIENGTLNTQEVEEE